MCSTNSDVIIADTLVDYALECVLTKEMEIRQQCSYHECLASAQLWCAHAENKFDNIGNRNWAGKEIYYNVAKSNY